jgi:ribosomal protein L17
VQVQQEVVAHSVVKLRYAAAVLSRCVTELALLVIDKMLKFLYAIAKAIPALQQILDKLFGVAKEHTAAARRTAKDDLVDSAIADALSFPSERMHGDKASEQRAADSTSTVSGSSTGSTGVHARSAQDDQPS